LSGLGRFTIAVLAGLIGWMIARLVAHSTSIDEGIAEWVGGLACAALAFGVGPQIARGLDRAASVVELSLGGMSAYEALSGAVGLLIGLIIAYSVRGAYEDLHLLQHFGPEPFYALWLPIVAFFAFLGFRIGRQRARRAPLLQEKLLDTSVIIDGRIVDIVSSGFVDGQLVVPRFVLGELQMLADSADPIRRARGKRGLEVLERLRGASRDFQVLDQQVDDHDVDGKLVTLARLRSAKILTNDYNLNRVAKLQGVNVLNINELSNAVKAVALPGEEMAVSIIKEGKEQNQGVGFLDDGTMVVVENGKEKKGEQVGIEVTSVLQTAAGRMIFAKLKR